MKNPIRLNNERLADALVERGLVERETAQLVLQHANTHGGVFCEILVQEGHVSDWEVSRVACEIFNLAFLPVEVAPPQAELVKELDPKHLRQHALVPVERFGDVLTVAMPGIVPTSVLSSLSTSESTVILPVVGSVTTNRAWINENLPTVEATAAPIPAAEEIQSDTGWTNIFDAGEEAVQLNLGDGELSEADLSFDELSFGSEDSPAAEAPAEPKIDPNRPRISLDESDFQDL